ncbi:MAG: hypothetical protein EAX86_02500 [Candidatus Heimdallarchaeota archaeon]|nr:hypothetical protein [Candidatus Heimdallarchaeota archaeon]
MSDTSRTSHSEAIAGVRIKRFLTLALLHISSELMNKSDSKSAKKFLESTIDDLVKSSFTLSSTDNPISQAKLFMASLGFSPCEIEWSEDIRLGRFLLGKSRIWKPKSAKEEELVALLILAIVKGLGYAFLQTAVEVKFVNDDLLPPRFSYEIQFRAAEDVFAESIKTVETKDKEQRVTLSAGALLEPILGTSVRVEEATRFLIEATREVTEEIQPDLLNRKDIADYPLKILEVLFIHLQGSDKSIDVAQRIGELMVDNLKLEYPDLKNHQILKGIGLIPVEQIDELLFYGNVEICGRGKEGKNIQFCQFLGHLWSGFASKVLGKKFIMAEDPLCASGKGKTCIFTLEEIIE